MEQDVFRDKQHRQGIIKGNDKTYISNNKKIIPTGKCMRAIAETTNRLRNVTYLAHHSR